MTESQNSFKLSKFSISVLTSFGTLSVLGIWLIAFANSGGLVERYIVSVIAVISETCLLFLVCCILKDKRYVYKNKNLARVYWFMLILQAITAGMFWHLNMNAALSTVLISMLCNPLFVRWLYLLFILSFFSGTRR